MAMESERAALERDILRSRGRPEHDAAWAVYGDWLQTQGDEHGELVLIEQTLEQTEDPEQLAAMASRRNELIAGRQPGWLGPLYQQPGLELSFDRGFVSRARLRSEVRAVGACVAQLLTLPICKFLDELTVDRLGFADAEVLDMALKASPVRALKLSSGFIDASALEGLSQDGLQGLNRLDLSHIERPAARLSEWNKLGALPALQHLSLEHCGLDRASLRPLVALGRGTLQSLQLSYNQLGTGERRGPQPLVQWLKAARPAHLALGRCLLKDDGLFGLLASEVLSGVQTLDLSANDIQSLGLRSGLETIRDLDLSYNPLSSAEIARQEGLESLRVLRLLGVQMSTAALVNLAKQLSPGGTLDLSAAMLGPQKLPPLLRALEAPAALNLSLCRLQEAEFGELPESLGALVLRGNRLREEGLERLLLSLPPSLQILDLSGNALGDRGAKLLAKSGALGGLTTLRLGSNEIGDRGAIALLKALELQNLQELWLDGNPVSDAFAKALSASTGAARLRVLNMNGTNLGQRGLREIAGSRMLSSLEALEVPDDQAARNILSLSNQLHPTLRWRWR